MADSRIKDLPDASPLVDSDYFAVDGTATGTRKTTLSALKSATAGTRPFQVSVSGLVLTVTAGTRLIRSGAALSYAGGTVSAPATDGVYFLCHTAANTLAVLAAWPAALDSLVLARVTVSGTGTIAAAVMQASLGGDLQAAHNLADVTNVNTARNNLGVGFLYQQAANITAAGNTELVVADANTDGVVRYTVVAGTAAYTRTISVSATNAPNGTKLTIMLDMPVAPVNAPTIEIRNGSGGSGALITTINSGPFARTERVELVYNPTTWVLVSSGPEPHAGLQQLAELDANQSPAGAIKFDASVGRYGQSQIRGISLEAGDYSAVCTFRVALNMETATAGVFSVSSSISAASAGTIGLLANASGGSFAIYNRDAGGGFGSSNIVLTPYIGRTIQFGLVRKAGVLSAFVDGQAVGYSANPNQAVPLSGTDTYIIIGNFSAAGVSYRERIHSFQLYNRALTGAELKMLAVRGVQTEDRLASGPWITPVTLNGGFEMPTTGNDFANWVESAGAGGAVVRDASIFAPDGGSQSCRFDMDAANASVSVAQTLVEPVRNYRISGWVRSNRAGGTSNLQLTLNGAASVVVPIPTIAQNTWGQFSVELTSGNYVASGLGTFGLVRYGPEDVSASRWFDGITLERIGCLVDLDLGAGSGFNLPDLQGKYPLVIAPASYSNFVHSRPARSGQFVHRVAAAGNTQISGVPEFARIANIIADANAGVTVSMGSSSGGSQIVASVALATGKNELTVALRYNQSRTLWVNHSSAIPVTYTVLYDIIGQVA
jgi:hypothetical protein